MPTLIATYASEAGGAERLLLDVAAGLSEPPLVACPEGWLADQARTAGLTVFTLPARSMRARQSTRDRVGATARLAAHARELRNLCRDVDPGLFVAWGMRTGLATAAGPARMSRRPPIAFQHFDFLPGPGVARAVRAAAARADLVLCVSRAIADDVDPDGALGDRLEVVPCGVDVERFRPPGGAVLRNEALLLGAIVPWKRPDVALEAVALAAARVPELRLRVAGAALDGDGERLLAELRERAARPDLAGRVDFTGPLGDPAGALRDTGCLIHCAEREPFGLVLAEALASGTPVVAPASGGPAEIADETCGALYPPGDAAAAANALVDVLARRDELSEGARRRAEAAFALGAMQARYRELFEATRTETSRSTGYRRDVGTFWQAAGGAGAGSAVVTVTHDSAPELERLVASLARHLPGARLIVVDNASADSSAEIARGAGAQVIENERNAGFGAAANAGIAAVGEPVTILLNPDVELIDDSLAGLAADARPGLLLAPLLLNSDGTRQDSVHPRPASAATALYAVVPGPLLPGPLRRAAEPWQSTEPRRVGWATAACLVAATETLRELGPFDPSIFLYAEDLDLGLRAETWFRPDARAIHTRAHSSARAFGGEPYELLARQRRGVVLNRLGRTAAKVDDVIEMTTFAERALLRRLRGRPATNETARLRARRDAARRSR